MSHPLLTDYLHYNQWANQKLTDFCREHYPDNWYQPTPGSYPNLAQIWLHLYDAQHLWLERLQGISHPIFPSRTLREPDPAYIQSLVTNSAQALAEWANAQSSDFWDTPIVYSNTKGTAFRQKPTEIVWHVCNHSTYHRGQVVVGLRYLSPGRAVPATDYIWFKRLTMNDEP